MSQINRRQFTTLSAAAIAASAVSGRSWAAPSEQLRVCVCGVNGRGMAHVQAAHGDPRTIVSAIVDIDLDVAEKRAAQIKELQGSKPKIYNDFRRALDDGDFDILTSAAPNHWHALMGIEAMMAGKDVYIEKPISHNITEGRALVSTANKTGRIFQTGTQCRSSDAVIEAAKFIQDGGIGECKFARGLCYKRRKSIGSLGDYPIPDQVDFGLWTGPATLTDPKLTRPQFHYDWHWQRHYGNGDSGNQGPHQTDIARWGLGLDRHPDQIVSYGGRLGYQAERDDPDYVDAGDTPNTQVTIYRYGDKSITFETRGLDVSKTMGDEVAKIFGDQRGNKVGVIFYGSDGLVAQTSYGKCLVLDRDYNVVEEFKHGGNLTLAHMSNFVDAVLSRDTSSLNADALCGHYSAAVSHLGNISYQVGEDNLVSVSELEAEISKAGGNDDNVATLARTVDHLRANGVDLDATPLSLGPMLEFDVTTERFAGNDAANALLTREYRTGFELPKVDLIAG